MLLSAAVLSLSAFTAAQQDTTPVRDTVFLQEFVVSGTRAAQAQRIDEPLALSVTNPTLAERGAGTVAAHLLRDMTGVHVQQTSAGQGAVVLRGMVGNQVLMLVNGVPMNNGTYRDGPGQYLATVDPETIERIEVVRGPASVLYGSDAQGGVVNIITRSHPQDGAASVRTAGSVSTADGSYRLRASAGAQGEHWSVAAGGTVTTAGDLRAGGDLDRQVPTGFDAEGLDAALKFWLGTSHTVSAVAQHFVMHDVPRYDRYFDFRAPDLGPDVEHVFAPQGRQLAYLRHTFTGRSAVLTKLETTVSLATQKEGRHRTKRLGSGVPDTMMTHWRDDVYTPGVSLVGSSAPSVVGRAIDLTWGAEWYHDALESSGSEENLRTGAEVPIELPTEDGGTVSAGNFPDGASADRIGVFLSAAAPVTGFLDLSVGGRWSQFRNQANVGVDFGGTVENNSSALTGQVGLVATPARRWRIAARLAQGFRAPNLYDLTRTGPVPGGVQLPNPDARPEQSLSGELSVRYSKPGLAFDVTAYAMRITDFIDRVPGEFEGDTLFNGERVYQGQNIGTAHIRGLEAEAAAALGPVRLETGVTYTYGTQTPASGIEEPMSKIPPLGGYATLRWTAPASPLTVEYVFRWALEQDRLGARDLGDPRIEPGGTPGFTEHGVRVSTSVSSTIKVSAGLDNIFDQLYRTHSSGVDTAGRHVWVGASWGWSVD
jgi:hemoglobin/transferrin/lactoferrin receptor protein